MSSKESYRIKVLEEVISSKLTVSEGSEILEISERQFYRLQRAYKKEGLKGLIHKSRGKTLKQRIRQRIKRKSNKYLQKGFHRFWTNIVFREVGRILPNQDKS